MGNNKMRNKTFMVVDKMFIECCRMANITPTSRQASKFRMGKGVAFRMKDRLIREKLLKRGVVRGEG